jgi:hypothetical protein
MTPWLLTLVLAAAPGGPPPEDPDTRARVLVLTDISNEPDDEEALVRFLVYSNEYDVEGLVATTSTHLRERTRLDLIRRQVEAYAKVRANLLVHAPGFPSVEHLLAVAKTGQPGYGMAAVGEGRTTDGSRLILEAADRTDERPLWVSVWGGANTLAQALWDARRTRSAEEVKGLVRRLRVYAISDQDDAGAWLRREFPDLAYAVSPSTEDWKEYWRATWTGISGDRHYRNGPGHRFELVDNPWLEENVIRGHGPLGALYPRLVYIMEGDTPSFLGLVRNGLGWVVSPAWGGWGGRYAWYRAHGEERPTWTNSHDSRDTVRTDDGREHTSDQATIWRWREHFQHDFAARMDWCVASSLAGANHNPRPVLNGDDSKGALRLTVRPGEAVRLSAEGTVDPDGHAVSLSWFVYREAGTFTGEVALGAGSGTQTSFVAPSVKDPATIHVVLEARDSGSPPLWAYRRAVVTVRP